MLLDWLNFPFKNLDFLLDDFKSDLNLVCQRLVAFCVPKCDCSFTIFAPKHPPHLLQTVVLMASQFFVLTKCVYVWESLLIQWLGDHSLNRKTESLLTLGELRPSVEDVAQVRLVMALVILFDYFLDRGVYFYSFTVDFLVSDQCLDVKLVRCTFMRFFVKLRHLNTVSDCKLSSSDFCPGLIYLWLGDPILKGRFDLVEDRLLLMLDLSFQNALKMFLVVYYFYPLLDASLSFNIVVPLESVCEYTLTLQNQVWLQQLVLDSCVA